MSVGELLQTVLVLATLVGIYVFMFRGLFGKTPSDRSLFAPGTGGKASDRGGDGPAWGTALMGGFAAAQLADATGWTPTALSTVAVIVGVSAALGDIWNWFSWPAAIVGYTATVASVVAFVLTNPAGGAWGLLFAVVLLAATGDLIRHALTWRRGASVADRAMAYFAGTEAALFIVSPGGVPVVDVLGVSGPVAKFVLALVLVGAPFLIGLLDSPFLTMFSVGIALAGLYLEFAGLGAIGFLANMGLLAAAMLSYWIVRWIVRGFKGVGLLSD